jgi:site-specific recombinase XerD
VSIVTIAPNDIAELVPEFTVMLQATNRSPRTVETYLRGVRGLGGFLHERGMPTAVDAIAREHVEAYFADLLDRGYKATSAKAWYDGIRQFFGWCEEEGEVADGRNPMRHVRAQGDLQSAQRSSRRADPRPAARLRRPNVRGSP